MKKFSYRGVDRAGRTINGSTMAASKEEVMNQLIEFGFKNIHIEEETATVSPAAQPAPEERMPEDFVQKLMDGDIKVEEAASAGEDEQYEWERAEALARIRHHRWRENAALVISLVLVGAVALYFLIDWMTAIPAPQPEIIARSNSELLSIKDAYVKGENLVFVVFCPNWNGNVRVDFKAWDPVDRKNPVDFGTARIGFVGNHYGGSPQKSAAFNLKKTRFYDRIEIVISGDEKR